MQIRKYPLRSSVIIIGFIACLIFFSVKLVLIQIFRSSYLADLAEKQHSYFVELESVRGSIYDRNLRPLAFNVAVYSLFANPRIMSDADKEKALQYLPGLLNLETALIQKRLSRKKYFVWIKRKLTSELVETIKQLKINGLDFRKESKRFYPNGYLAAHIIGFAGTDNQGLEGLELSYNRELKGQSGRMQVYRDARQKGLMLGNHYIPPQDGHHLILTIDETVQYVAERALEKGMKKHNAKSASIIVMDIKTGEILALANRPTYNLGEVAKSDIGSRTNRAISFVYEPGSVFKIVAAAAALEEEKFIETDTIFCENGEYKVGNHILHDHHPQGKLTFREVFEKSSNIGVTKISQKLGPNKIYKYGKRFNFGNKTGIDLKGEVSGHLKHPSRWSKTSIGAIPIGQEVIVTPLQLASAISAVANNGLYMKPFVVKYIKDQHDQVIKSFSPKIIDRVISPDTARRVKEILAGVVESGTGKRAQIKGIRVAGKTGTAQKVENKRYSHTKFYASFIGFAPVDNPRIAAVVVYDEPHPSHYGGTVAAPVFQEVVESALKYLGSLER